MKNGYRKFKNTVSKVQFHIVFCPRYKRKIFNVEGVRERFEMLARTECENNDIDILEMDCGKDYVHLKLNVPPTMSANDAMYAIKRNTAKKLQEEFPMFASMTALWTQTCLVTTDDKLSQKDIDDFVMSLPSSPYMKKG